MEDLTQPNQESKFNIAIETLMRISEILTNIRKLSNEEVLHSLNISAGQAQHMKFREIKNLIIRSAPLLKEDKVKELYNKLINTKLKSKENINTKSGKIREIVEKYDPAIDVIFDNIILDLEFALQKGKYFASMKSESALF